MKRYLCVFIPALFITLCGCKNSFDNVAPGTTGNNNGTLVAYADTTKGYSPNTAGSFLKYNITTNGTLVDGLTNTILGTTLTINNKTYSVVTETSNSGNVAIGYYSNVAHIYTVRNATTARGVFTDILYLEDNLAVGSQWTAAFTDDGTLEDSPARLVGTITGKNISKTVSGKIFNNIIHTTVLLQHDLGPGFVTYGTYDFYIAKGIGIIELDCVLGFPGVPTVNSTETLVDYSIK